MNGFLLLIRHELEDLPFGLHASRKHALDAVKLLRDPDKAGERMAGLMQTDCSTPLVISLIEFRGGMPVSYKIIKDLWANDDREVPLKIAE